MLVTSWDWYEDEGATPPQVGMFWPREYELLDDPTLVCPQCGNTWHRLYFEHGVCFDCWGTFWIDWTDIPFEEE